MGTFSCAVGVRHLTMQGFALCQLSLGTGAHPHRSVAISTLVLWTPERASERQHDEPSLGNPFRMRSTHGSSLKGLHMCIPPLIGVKVRNPARLDEQRGDLRLLAFARTATASGSSLRGRALVTSASGDPGSAVPGHLPVLKTLLIVGPATHRQEVVSMAPWKRHSLSMAS